MSARWPWAVMALALSASGVPLAAADVIHLKNGKQIEAKIIKKTDQAVVVDWAGSPLTYWMHEVDHIAASGPTPRPAAAEAPATKSAEAARPSPGSLSAPSTPAAAALPVSGAAPDGHARPLEAQLQEFLMSRRPSAADASAKVVTLELQSAGAEKPNAYVLPEPVIIEFVNELFGARKDFEGAVTICRAYLKSMPEQGLTYHRIGAALEALGRTDEAIPEYQTAARLEKAQAYMPYFRLWGIEAFLRNAPEKADALWKEFEGRFAVLEAKEQAYMRQVLVSEAFLIGLHQLNATRQFDLAMKEFQMALRLEPDSEPAKLDLFLARFNQGVQARDAALFDQALADIRQLAGATQNSAVAQGATDAIRKSDEIRRTVFGAD